MLFSLRSSTGQGYPPSPLIFSMLLEILSSAIRQEKSLKFIQTGEEEIKLPLSAGEVNVY